MGIVVGFIKRQYFCFTIILGFAIVNPEVLSALPPGPPGPPSASQFGGEQKTFSNRSPRAKAVGKKIKSKSKPTVIKKTGRKASINTTRKKSLSKIKKLHEGKKSQITKKKRQATKNKKKQQGKDIRWFSKLDVHPLDKVSMCLMETENMKIFDGENFIKLRIVYARDKLVIITNANVDPSYDNVGITVDNKNHLKFDLYRDKTTAVINGFSDEKLKYFSKGKIAELSIGFWPSWPKTEPSKVLIDLAGFRKEHDKYKVCVKGLLN